MKTIKEALATPTSEALATLDALDAKDRHEAIVTLVNGLRDLELLRRLNHDVIDAIKVAERRIAYQFAVGDKVEFDSRKRPGVTIVGTVESIGRTGIVRVREDGAQYGMTWCVSASMLRPAAKKGG